MIEIRDVRVTYGGLTVLKGLTTSVAAGECVVLTGPNGAGKTTLLRCLLGQVQYSGVVRIGGFDVIRDGRRARRLIGYVPQLPSFPPGLDVDEVVAFFQRLRGEVAAPLPLLEAVGLASAAGRTPAALSGGMLRRLALAVALIADPPLLVMDEPTSNLDPEGEADLRGWLDRLRDRERTVLLASHQVGAFQHVADRVAVLRDGRIAADLPIEAFLDARRVTLTIAGRTCDLQTVANRAPLGLVEAITLNSALHLSIGPHDLPAVFAALDGPALRHCRLTVDVHDTPAMRTRTPVAGEESGT
ncbi:MAG TPA: ABC transporter ATP-binding protein [bacterium]|nr:ABC transporter ATP-binding protein [bacterium]